MNQLRLGLAFVGFGLALIGVVLDNRWLIWAAIVALIGAFLIRLWLRRAQNP